MIVANPLLKCGPAAHPFYMGNKSVAPGVVFQVSNLSVSSPQFLAEQKRSGWLERKAGVNDQRVGISLEGESNLGRTRPYSHV